MKPIAPAAALVAIVCAGCADGLLAPEQTVHVRVLQESVVLERWEANLGAHEPLVWVNGDFQVLVDNAGGTPVFVRSCDEIAWLLEKRVDGAWEVALATDGCSTLQTFSRVDARSQRTFDVSVTAYLPGSQGEPVLQVDEVEGTYRIVIDTIVDAFDPGTGESGEGLPREARTSTRFEVRMVEGS